MTGYYSVAIYENPDAPPTERKVIGAAIFDRDSGSRPYGAFIGLLSHYDARDYNFSGEVTLWEQFMSGVIPGNYAETRFTYQAFTQLLVETADPFFQTARVSALKPYVVELAQWGFEQVYGIPPPTAHNIVEFFGDQLIGSIVENSPFGYVGQFFLREGLDYLFDEIFLGTFVSQPESTSAFPVHYVGSGQTSLFLAASDVVVPYAGSVNLLISSTSSNIYGTPYEDEITVTSGGVSIGAGDGDDVIKAAEGAIYIDAGSGDDTVETYASARISQTVIGGAGNDLVLARRVESGQNGLYYLDVDGGPGTNRLIIETGGNSGGSQGLRHQFLDSANSGYSLGWHDSFFFDRGSHCEWIATQDVGHLARKWWWRNFRCVHSRQQY